MQHTHRCMRGLRWECHTRHTLVHFRAITAISCATNGLSFFFFLLRAAMLWNWFERRVGGVDSTCTSSGLQRLQVGRIAATIFTVVNTRLRGDVCQMQIGRLRCSNLMPQSEKSFYFSCSQDGVYLVSIFAAAAAAEPASACARTCALFASLAASKSRRAGSIRSR